MKNDDDLRLDVIDELEREPGIDASSIGVAVTDAVVTLTGHVRSYSEKIHAEKAAQRVQGIRGIAQEMEVRLPAEHVRDDADIASAVANALRWNIWVPAERIKVRVERGWVTLSGMVGTGFERRSAERAVRDLTGVRGVTNLIESEPKADPDSVRREIDKTLHEAITRDTRRISIEASDGTVTLRGKVRSWSEREDAERAAYASKGVAKVQNFITLG